MSYAHYPHVWTHEWFLLHPESLATIKRYSLAFAGVCLLVLTALLILTIHASFDVPLQSDEAITALTDALFLATGMSGYIPPQYLVVP